MSFFLIYKEKSNAHSAPRMTPIGLVVPFIIMYFIDYIIAHLKKFCYIEAAAALDEGAVFFYLFLNFIEMVAGAANQEKRG